MSLAKQIPAKVGNEISRWSLKAYISLCIGIATYFLWFHYFGLWFPYFDWGAIITGIVGFVVSFLGVHWISKRFEATLQARASVKNPVALEVNVNGVCVGSVTEAEYASMVLRSFRDGRNASAQLLNLMYVLMRAGSDLLREIPLVLFWGVVTLVVFAPESFTHVMGELQKAGPGGIAAVTKTALSAVIPSYLLIRIFISVLCGEGFGLVDRFGEAVNQMLGQHCNVQVKGDVSVTRPKHRPSAAA